MEPPETRVESPEELYEKALQERKSPNPTTRKEACEKGWLVVTRAVDGFLALRGHWIPEGDPNAHSMRRDALAEVAHTDPSTIDLKRKVEEVATDLHGQCFYAGRDHPYYDTLLKKTVREILEQTGHPINGAEEDLPLEP